MKEIKDYVGNILDIGDDVVVLSSGNSSWRKGKVTGFTENWSGHPKVQVEYNDHWYCNLKHYELNGVYNGIYNEESPKIKFYMKPVKVSVDIFNIVKLLPEYLED